MKRILFIAPSSYPANGPEAFVNAKHIFALTKAGFYVDLVCRGIRDISNFYPSDGDTPYFFRGLKSINVIKVDTKYNVKTLFRHLKTLIKTGYVYKASDWSFDAISFCERNLDIKNYDFVLTKDYPSEIVGVYFAKKYRIKWIPTWNDPYMWKKYPAPYGEGANYKEGFFRKKLIKDISKYAYKHIFPSIRLRDYMLSYMNGMRKNNCIIMPHILMDIDETSNYVKKGNVLRIIHTGSIGLQRNPMKLFHSLKKFKENYPQKEISVTFLGIIQGISSETINEDIKRLGLVDIVDFKKPVKYEEIFKIVDEYDVCMVLEAPCEEGIFLPSKLIDYLQKKKKIFAISPANGVLFDLYKDSIIDYFADVVNENSIYSALVEMHNDFVVNKSKKKKDLHVFELSSIIKLHEDLIFK